MKLAIYDATDGPRPAFVVDDAVIDVPDRFADAASFPGVAHGHLDELAAVAASHAATLAAGAHAAGMVGKVDDVPLRAPVVAPPKILCVGLNYLDHIEEVGLAAPTRPHVFAKLPTALNHPGADIEVPWEIADQIDWEAELAVVIGAGGRDIPEDDALKHVLGFTAANDVSARDWQFDADGQLTLGKGFDTFLPLGPWIVTRDEIGDPQDLRVRCLVDGEVRQDASTSTMVFGVAHLVSFLSRVCTLRPGDVIATGTPAGVGFGRDPKVFLEPGQEVVVEIDRIGVLRNRVGAR